MTEQNAQDLNALIGEIAEIDQKRSEKLSKLRDKKAELERKIKEEQSAASAQRRKNETRAAILVGKFIMQNQAEIKRFKSPEVWSQFDKFLTRQQDRELFGLQDKEK